MAIDKGDYPQTWLKLQGAISTKKGWKHPERNEILKCLKNADIKYPTLSNSISLTDQFSSYLFSQPSFDKDVKEHAKAIFGISNTNIQVYDMLNNDLIQIDKNTISDLSISVKPLSEYKNYYVPMGCIIPDYYYNYIINSTVDIIEITQTFLINGIPTNDTQKINYMNAKSFIKTIDGIHYFIVMTDFKSLGVTNSEIYLKFIGEGGDVLFTYYFSGVLKQ